MSTVESVAARLRADAASGVLASVCEPLGVDLLVLFGSARQTPGSAHDVDVAYSGVRYGEADHLAVVNALEERYGDQFDVLALDRAGIVARFEALARGDVLVELTPGKFARRQMAAMGEFYDTQHLRDLALRVMSE